MCPFHIDGPHHSQNLLQCIPLVVLLNRFFIQKINYVHLPVWPVTTPRIITHKAEKTNGFILLCVL